MKSITKMKKEVLPVKKGQHIFGTVKVGEKGQIVIPKEARRIFDIKAGDTLLVLGDEAQGLAVVKADVMQELAVSILKGLGTLGGGLHEK
jgi:AbrB family looped-hinge helix DNA binding protein